LDIYEPTIIVVVTEVAPGYSTQQLIPTDVSIQGFELISWLHEGRGLAIYIKQGVRYEIVKADKYAIWLHLKFATPVRVACMYRSPSNTDAEN
jgi:hypothetical protein